MSNRPRTTGKLHLYTTKGHPRRNASAFVIAVANSIFDGQPIAVVVHTGSNSKLSRTSSEGVVLQISYLPFKNQPVTEYIKGADRSVCPKDCPHRYENSTDPKQNCYVWSNIRSRTALDKHSRTVQDMPQVDFKVFLQWVEDLGSNIGLVRFGRYGDPAALLNTTCKIIYQVQKYEIPYVGYTRAWKRASVTRRLAGIFPASVKDEAEAAKAFMNGWTTTFLPVDPEKDISHTWAKTKWCPATKSNGYKATCSECLLCGSRRASKNDTATIIRVDPTGQNFNVVMD